MKKEPIILLMGFLIIFLGCVGAFQAPQGQNETVYESVAERISPPAECEAPLTEEEKEEVAKEAVPAEGQVEEEQVLGDVNFRYRGCGTEDTIDTFQGYRFTRIQLTADGYYAVFCKDSGCEDEKRIAEGDNIVANGYCLKLNKLVKGYILCNDYLQATISKC